jgi:hypothetical protein
MEAKGYYRRRDSKFQREAYLGPIQSFRFDDSHITIDLLPFRLAASQLTPPWYILRSVARIQNFEPSCDLSIVGSRTPLVPIFDTRIGFPLRNSVQFNPSLVLLIAKEMVSPFAKPSPVNCSGLVSQSETFDGGVYISK